MVIKVAVVDDEALVRSGFEMILGSAPDIEVVGTADGPGAIPLIDAAAPDVVLLDIRMPERNGLEVLTELRSRAARPVVAILTTFDTDAHIARALGLGAAGFLVKDTDPDQLPDLVRTLAAGGTALSPQVSRHVIAGYLNRSGRKVPDHIERLTERERQVLVLLSDGLSNTQIGLRMHLSVGTIKDHVSNILTKLEVDSRLQAALIAERAGLRQSETGR